MLQTPGADDFNLVDRAGSTPLISWTFMEVVEIDK